MALPKDTLKEASVRNLELRIPEALVIAKDTLAANSSKVGIRLSLLDNQEPIPSATAWGIEVAPFVAVDT